MSYSSAVLTLTPTIYYQLQDSLSDNSGNANAALVRGASTAEPAYAAGIVDSAPRGLSFDGSNDYAYVPAVTYASNKTSLVCWVNFAALSGTQVIFEMTTNYGTTVPGVGSATFLVYSDGANLGIGMADHAAGSTNFETWTFPLPGTNNLHFGVVFDRSLTGAGRCKVYYDKVAQTASASSTRTDTYDFATGKDMYLMARGAGTFPTGALLDDFALWTSTALTSTNITTLYDAATATASAPAVRRRPSGLYTR